MNEPLSFADSLLPAPRNGGFAMPDYWIWCASVIRGEDGRWHMFAARWPRQLPFFEGYLTHSEIVRAVADSPAGPYVFEEVVLPARGGGFWDGRMTHNPTIHKAGDVYLLFYIGSTYAREQPPLPPPGSEAWHTYKSPPECYGNIRIGLATSPAITGPWKRLDEPILAPRPGRWDAHIVTNPAPCIREDGQILLLYRSNTPDGLWLGAAVADDWTTPFRRLHDEPIPAFFGENHVEDPFLWWTDGHYELLAKDLTGALTGELHAGLHAVSPDAFNWRLSQPPKAYSRRIVWDDGTVTQQGCLERPQLLFEDGRPSCLFAATGDGEGGFNHCTRTWNVAIPLRH